MRIIRGIWAEERLTSPGRRVRPTHETVRDAWMTYLEPCLQNARILDLFAGSGALGLEAMSRGAWCVDFVDDSGEALHALKANVAKRRIRVARRGHGRTEGNKSARIFKRDAIPFVAHLEPDVYDIAFADPPYGSRKLDRIVERWVDSPFAPLLCVEHAPDHVVPAGAAHRLDFEGSAITFYGTLPTLE